MGSVMGCNIALVDDELIEWKSSSAHPFLLASRFAVLLPSAVGDRQ